MFGLAVDVSKTLILSIRTRACGGNGYVQCVIRVVNVPLTPYGVGHTWKVVVRANLIESIPYAHGYNMKIKGLA